MKEKLEHRGADGRAFGWYCDLVEALTNDAAGGEGKKLSILTFNYDRTLEFFLLRALKGFFREKSGLK